MERAHMNRPFDQLVSPFWDEPVPPGFQGAGEWSIRLLGLPEHVSKDERALWRRLAMPRNVYAYRVTVQDPCGERGYSASFLGYLVSASAHPVSAPRLVI